jgi:hypothetical protein
MPSLIGHYAQCRRLLCLAAKRRQTITYGALATALGLKSPRQQWNTVLGPIAANEVKTTGHDLTLVVVYASGPAKGLGRYFSNIRGGARPQSSYLESAQSSTSRIIQAGATAGVQPVRRCSMLIRQRAR